MYREQRTLKEDRCQNQNRNPSFSSTLLDKIIRSIEEDEKTSGELQIFRETIGMKQSRGNNRAFKQEETITSTLGRANLSEKWIGKKMIHKLEIQRRNFPLEWERNLKSELDHDLDQDVVFFSFTSISSDSSSGGFSSSDTESSYGVRSRSPCHVPLRPKPIRTKAAAKSETPENRGKTKQNNAFQEQGKWHNFDAYRHNSRTENISKHEQDLIKYKSRALQIYCNLKKLKQPISPGGRLTSFLNSLFSTEHTKKMKKTLKIPEPIIQSDPSCSSALSISRSCLIKKSPTRERFRNGIKRRVRFFPITVIVDEDCRPCGHKCLYEEEDTISMLGRSHSDDELNFLVKEKSRRREEDAREFLKDYRQTQKINDLVMRDFQFNRVVVDDEDDAASYSSSDLFELDHLGNNNSLRFCEDLPVYETTDHVSTYQYRMGS